MNKTIQTLLIAWNLVLTAVVAYLLLAGPQTAVNEAATTPAVRPAGGEPTLVYVNTDTLLAHYPYYRELNDGFKRKQDSLEKVIDGRSAALEREIRQYQETGGGMTPEQRQQKEESLYKKQQELVAYRESLLGKLNADEEKLMNKLHADLELELKTYNNGRYRFIFGYQKGSGILFADDSLDRTQEVIEALKKSDQ